MDVFDAAIIVGGSALIMAVGAKLYEVRQDVLYGPYINSNDQLDLH